MTVPLRSPGPPPQLKTYLALVLGLGSLLGFGRALAPLSDS